MIDADTYVGGLRADLNFRLDRMYCVDLARALRGLTEAEIAHIICRYDLLQAVEDDGGAPDVVEAVLQ